MPVGAVDDPVLSDIGPQPQCRANLVVAAALILSLSMTLSIIKAATAPITYDEAYTYLRFSRQSSAAILRDYHVPNNHLLHTLVVRRAVRHFGNEPWAVRLPALLGGAASLLALGVLTCRWGGAGILCLCVALLPAVVNYHALARGYSLGSAFILWTLVVLLPSDDAGVPVRGAAWGRWLVAGLFGGLSIACVPTMGPIWLSVIAAAVLVRVISMWRDGVRGVLRGVLGAASSCAVAAAVAWSFYRHIKLDSAQWPWGYDTFVAFGSAFWNYLLDLPAAPPNVWHASAGVMIAAASLYSGVTAVRSRSWSVVMCLLFMWLVPAAFAAAHAIQGVRYPFARAMLPLAMLVAVPVVMARLHAMKRRQRARRWIGVTVCGAAVAAAVVTFDPVVHEEWRSNAGVPGALAAIVTDIDTADRAIRVVIPWQINVCVEYELLRHPHEAWQIATEGDGDYSVLLHLPSRESRESGNVIHRDDRAGLYVVRR